MKNLVLLSLVLLCSCRCTQPSQTEVILQNKYDSLSKVLKEERYFIAEQEVQIQILKDEIQFRESEVSYWGHKYDSCSNYSSYKK